MTKPQLRFDLSTTTSLVGLGWEELLIITMLQLEGIVNGQLGVQKPQLMMHSWTGKTPIAQHADGVD